MILNMPLQIYSFPATNYNSIGFCRYEFNMQKLTWQDARENCKLRSKTLAKVATEEDTSQLSDLIEHVKDFVIKSNGEDL